MTYDDFTQVYGTQSGAVDMLGDGSIDAAFLGGAVPTGAVTQASSTHDIVFLPFDEEKRQELARDYPFFQLATIPADAYSDLTEDYPGLNVGSMHLITYADADEELVYQVTKTMWENRQAIAEKHPAGRGDQRGERRSQHRHAVPSGGGALLPRDRYLAPEAGG